MMTGFGSEGPLDPDEDGRKWNPRTQYFMIMLASEGFLNGANQIDSAMPRRRVRAISGRSWNNCIPEYCPFLCSNSHTKIHSPQSSNRSCNGDTDLALNVVLTSTLYPQSHVSVQ